MSTTTKSALIDGQAAANRDQAADSGLTASRYRLRRPQLHHWILITGLLISASVVVTGQQAQARIEASVMSRIHAEMSAALDSLLLDVRSMLISLSTLVTTTDHHISMSFDPRQSAADRRYSTFVGVAAGVLPDLRTLILINGDGVVVEDSRRDRPGIGIDVSDRDYFRAHAGRDDVGLHLSVPVVSRVDGDWTWVLSSRISGADGVRAGVVAASVDRRYFGPVFDLHDTLSGAQYLMMHLDGTVLEANGEARYLIGSTMTRGSRWLPEQPGTSVREAEVPWAAGSHLVLERQVDNWPIVIISSLDKARVSEQVSSQKMPIQAATATIVLVIMLTTLALSVQVRRVKRVERTLLDKDEQLTSAEHLAQMGSFAWTPATGRVILSDGMYALLGLGQPSEPAPLLLADVFKFPDHEPNLEQWLGESVKNGVEILEPELHRLIYRDGTILHVRTNGRIEYDQNRPVRVVVTCQNISESVAAQRRIEKTRGVLERISHFDPLTGLPNRSLLEDRLRQAMIQASRNDRMVGVGFIDIDRFKSINDALGQEAGDKVLVEAARSMQQALRDGDSLARFGGDEFITLLTDLHSPSECLAVMQRLQRAVRREISRDGQTLILSASVGIAFYPQRSQAVPAIEDPAPDQLLRQADQAMYQAKLAGRNRIRVYDPSHDRNLQGRYQGLESVRHALRAQQMRLYYQPIIHARTGTPVAAEALIRWQHPERGLLLPENFLPLIARSAVSIELGEWVIQTAVAFASEMESMGDPLRISVNIDAHQLQQPDFVERLRVILGPKLHAMAGRLEFELLESSSIEDTAATAKTIRRCKELGIRFAIDDFGTGYSSLSYLRQLPVDEVKIDRSFIRGLVEDDEDRAIVRGIIGLARAFDLNLIAEGVETREHVELLQASDCHCMQGYFIARPMTGEQLGSWLRHWSPQTFLSQTQTGAGWHPL